jgi:hypothetical protein
MLNGIYAECHKQANYAECHYAERHYAEGCYAQCHYAECHSTPRTELLSGAPLV